jgi:hypothetical protein
LTAEYDDMLLSAADAAALAWMQSAGLEEGGEGGLGEVDVVPMMWLLLRCESY